MGLIKVLSNLAQCHGCVGGQLSYPPGNDCPREDSHQHAGTPGQRPAVSDFDPVLGSIYEPIRLLGTGNVGKTWLMRHKERSELVAVKLIKRPLPPYITQSILREISIQSQLAYGHQGIVVPYEAVLTPSYLAIVMEYCAGGTLLELLEERVMRAQSTGFYMSEDEARYYIKQFIEAIGYCHAHHVVHRDLKLENTLLDNSVPPHIKLSDFGTSRETAATANCFTHVGTLAYMGPQLLHSKSSEQGYNGAAQDVWSSGVLLCGMLFGVFPFDALPPGTAASPQSVAQQEHDIWQQQVTRSWCNHPQLALALDKLSAECKDLLNAMLQPEEGARITIEGIKAHPWYTKPLPARFQAAWDDIQLQEHQIQAHGAQHKISPALADKRAKDIEQLVQQATQRASEAQAGEPPLVINLREGSIMAPAMTAVSEDA